MNNYQNLSTDVFINTGYGNSVNSKKVLAVQPMPSAAAQKLLTAAKELGKIIDATAGRRTRAIIVLEGGYIMTSGVNSVTLQTRLNGREDE